MNRDPGRLSFSLPGFASVSLSPGQPGYERHRRVWNGSIDKRPAAIARCQSWQDVAAAVRATRDQHLPVTVRSGGHSFPGLSVADGAVMIDLSPMKGVRVDPDHRRVRVQAGALLGEVDDATQAHGLAVPSGIVSHTGVAGLTLGGGLGWIMRKHGLSIDHLVSLELITANAERVRASASENSELFWGLRGGGGNFGIVTQFDFEAVPLNRHVLAGPIVWPMKHARRVMSLYRDWVAEAPDDLTTIVVLRKAPASPQFPVELHREPVMMVVCCWAGDVDEGQAFIGTLRTIAPPSLDLCAVRPFVEHQSAFDSSYPRGRWYYSSSCDVADLNEDIIEVAVAYLSRARSPFTSAAIWHTGGAVARVDEDGTAFHSRSPGYTFNIVASTETQTGFHDERRWVSGFSSALQPWRQGVYVNFLGNEGEARVRATYGKLKYSRLQALKARLDPGNFFWANQNISPLV